MLKAAHPELGVHAFAYGCPPVVSRDIATDPNTLTTVTVVVLNHDLVCRIGIGHINTLRRDAEELVGHLT